MAGIHTFAAFIKDSQELLTTAEAQCPGYDILLLLVRIHVCVLEGRCLSVSECVYVCVCVCPCDRVHYILCRLQRGFVYQFYV